MVILVKVILTICVIATMLLGIVGWSYVPSADSWKDKMVDWIFYASLGATAFWLIEVVISS